MVQVATTRCQTRGTMQRLSMRFRQFHGSKWEIRLLLRIKKASDWNRLLNIDHDPTNHVQTFLLTPEHSQDGTVWKLNQ